MAKDGIPVQPKPTNFAKTDVTECTPKVTKYPFPGRNLITLYDLPGAGTKLFPIETYKEKVDLQSYDVFVLLCAVRFTENDMNIYNLIKGCGKPCFLARSKLDVDLTNKVEEGDIASLEQWNKVEEKIRYDCIKDLRNPPKEGVYLLSKKHHKIVDPVTNGSRFVVKFKDNSKLLKDIINKLVINT